jgi:hypothetical protein
MVGARNRLPSADFPEGFTLLADALVIPHAQDPGDPSTKDQEMILSVVEGGELVQEGVVCCR